MNKCALTFFLFTPSAWGSEATRLSVFRMDYFEPKKLLLHARGSQQQKVVASSYPARPNVALINSTLESRVF